MFQKHCSLIGLNPLIEFLKAAGKLYDPNNPVTVESDPEVENDSESDY